MFGTTLVAEGIETRDDRALRDLDIPTAGAGCWGGPQPWRVKPSRADPGCAARPPVADAAAPGADRAPRHLARSLRVVAGPPVTPATTNDAVAAMFHERANCALAVVDGTQPVALINRQQFANHHATLYFREVHGRKPCLAFANTGAARGGA